jgi:hypothetical protein
MRRDVVGCAGSTQRISLPVFALSLIHYLSIRSKKHADKILSPVTGAHKFPSEATYITSKLWKKIQEFKVHRLLLSYCEALQHVRKIWAEDMELFHSCGKDESFDICNRGAAGDAHRERLARRRHDNGKLELDRALRRSRDCERA